MEIKSKELERILCAATNRWYASEITDEDMKNIRELTIPGVKLTREPTDIDLSEVSKLGNLENLEEITLTDFEIGDSINEVLRAFPNLKVLKFGNCGFEQCSKIETSQPLELFSIFGAEGIKGKKFPVASNVLVSNAQISFESVNWEAVEYAGFTNCAVYDARSLENYKNIREIELIDSSLVGTISESGEIGPLRNIKVSSETIYSNKSKNIDIEDELR